MMEFWVKPGMEMALEEVIVEVQEFLTKLGGPFPTQAYRVRFGDVGRVVYTVFLEDWADFLGTRSFQRGLAEAGLVEEWQALMERYMECITKSHTSRLTHMPDQSYAGPGG